MGHLKGIFALLAWDGSTGTLTVGGNTFAVRQECQSETDCHGRLGSPPKLCCAKSYPVRAVIWNRRSSSWPTSILTV